jgi:hypothetical protein
MVRRAVSQLYGDVLRPSGLRVTDLGILATLARMGEVNPAQLTLAIVRQRRRAPSRAKRLVLLDSRMIGLRPN